MLAANCGIASQVGIYGRQNGVQRKLRHLGLFPEILCASMSWLTLLWREALPVCRYAEFSATHRGIVDYILDSSSNHRNS
jgi:hypothetical protein